MMMSDEQNDLSDDARISLVALQHAMCKGVEALNFIDVTCYTTFLAEYAFDGRDIILHFYQTEEKKGQIDYWLQVFPRVLDVVARQEFDADYPRLSAAYTEEMDSWWLRARGYEHLLDRNAFTERFLERLDQVLETTTST